MTRRSERERHARSIHSCPVPDCVSWAPRDLLMCAPHWRRVPASLKRRVWQTFAEGAGQGSPEHVAACRAAVQAVEGRS